MGLEKTVELKQNFVAVRIISVFFAIVMFGLIIFLAILNYKDQNLLIVIVVFIGFEIICILFSIFTNIFVKTKEIYSADGIVRVKDGEVICEIKWAEVEELIYCKMSFQNFFSYSPGMFFIQLKTYCIKDNLVVIKLFYSKKQIQLLQEFAPCAIRIE